MPTSVGPNTYGEENLVFGFDTGDTVNSYKGQPIHNVVRPLDEWQVSNRINIVEVSGSDWNSPVPGARMWKCYYSSSIAANSLTRDSNSSNPLLISGSFGKSLYLYSMWVRGFDTNPSNSSISIDVHDQNVLNKSIADSQWKKLAVINSNENTGHPTYLFHDLQVYPTNSTKVDFLITGLMLARSSGSTYQELTPVTNTNIQWLPEGAVREVDESLVDLTGNSTLDLTNVSFDSNAQIDFDGTDDRIQIADSSAVSVTGAEITLEVVVRKDTNGSMVPIHKDYQYSIRINSDNSITYADSSVWSYSNFGNHSTGNTNGSYAHIVATKSNGIVTLYSNGEVVVSKSFGGNITHASNDLFIGAYSGTSNYMNGAIPIAKIYNRALTTSEIKANYNAIKGRFNI